VGFFEELTTEDAQAQFATNLNGILNVTRAVLPVMRRARQGRIFNLSSLDGIVGAQSATALVENCEVIDNTMYGRSKMRARASIKS